MLLENVFDFWNSELLNDLIDIPFLKTGNFPLYEHIKDVGNEINIDFMYFYKFRRLEEI
jgi:hypothetical protein